MLRQDYLKRLIEQLAAFVAKVTGLLAAGRLAEAEQEIQSAEQTLGLPLGSERLDARSLALLLGGGDRVVLAGILFEQRAALAAARGDTRTAAQGLARARELVAVAKPRELVREAAELQARTVPQGLDDR